jgi:hypothetical protein
MFILNLGSKMKNDCLNYPTPRAYYGYFTTTPDGLTEQ